MPRKRVPPSPFRRFNSSPEVIRLVVMMYVKYPLSLRNVEDLLAERGIDVCHETVRFWWNRFGPMFAAEIRRKRVDRMRQHTQWRWHLDEVYVKINGEMHYLWRAVDHVGKARRGRRRRPHRRSRPAGSRRRGRREPHRALPRAAPPPGALEPFAQARSWNSRPAPAGAV